MDQKKIEYDNCPVFLKDFLFYLETIVGRSKKTVYEYYLDIRTFLRFMLIYKDLSPLDVDFNQIDISNFSIDVLKGVTLSDVYEYMHYISSERGNINGTRARKVSSLKGLYKYLSLKSNYNIANPLENLEMPAIRKSLPKYLSLEQSIQVLESVDGPYKERDFCILTLFLNCGMRVSELVGINIQDIREDSIRILGKGNKERILYLNQACVQAIEEYIAVRPKDIKEKKALFVSRNGNRIHVRRVQQIVEITLKKVGLDGQGYSTHKLRHTAATLMYQYGDVDIRVLKEILGHEAITTTEIYTHVSNKQLEAAAAKSPLSNIKRKK